MATARGQIADLRLRMSLTAFLKWWRAALLASVPRPLLRLIGGRRTLVRFRGSTITVASGRSTPTTVELDPLEGAGQRLRSALGAAHRRRGILVEIDPDTALQSDIEVPAEATANLREVVAGEIEKRTPFAREEVVHRFQILGASEDLGAVRVRLTVVPRRYIDEALQLVTSAGARVSAVVLQEQRSDEPVHLMDGVGRSGQFGVVLPMVVAVAMLAITAAVGFQEFSRLQSILGEADATLAQLRTKSIALEAEVAEAVSSEAVLTAVAASKSDKMPAFLVLSELTRAVPDDSWVNQIQLADRRVVVTGFSADPAELLRSIDESPFFEGTRFSAPVTQGRGDHMRFQITLSLVGSAGS